MKKGARLLSLIPSSEIAIIFHLFFLKSYTHNDFFDHCRLSPQCQPAIIHPTLVFPLLLSPLIGQVVLFQPAKCFFLVSVNLPALYHLFSPLLYLYDYKSCELLIRFLCDFYYFICITHFVYNIYVAKT